MNKYLESIIRQEVPVIKFDSLNKIPFIVHGFSTRLGGVSEGIYSSMNLSFNRGDDKKNVLENYRIIGDKLGVKIDNMVLSAQTHTTNILRVVRNDCGKGITKQQDYNDIDGLITNEAGIMLVTSYADCVPLFFVDVRNKVIALSHSGWRGTVNKMGRVTIERMKSEFGSNEEDIKCVIGPSICKDCYEVSEDVVEEFSKKFTVDQCRQIYTQTSIDKYHLNLWKANEIILKEAGILEENIENRCICTCCNKEILFSHRGLNGKRGNLAAFLMIKNV